MEQQQEIWAVIPAAGSGSRMQSVLPKQYLPLCGSTVLDITISKILSAIDVAGVVVALSEDDVLWPQSRYASHEKVQVCFGGKERSDSVQNALIRIQSLSSCSSEQRWVLVHDAARPCVTREKIVELWETCRQNTTGAILASPAADTLKRVNDDQEIVKTEDRSQIWLAHTPQLFPYELLRRSLDVCKAQQSAVTDEASAVEQNGGSVLVVADRRDNIKITMPEDLLWAETILNNQKHSVGQV